MILAKSLFRLSLFIVLQMPFRLSAQIQQALKMERGNSYYPISVERFY
jgi:hypothetical protein